MSTKAILLMTLAGACCGVVVDEKETKEGSAVKTSHHQDWDLVHLPPKQHLWYKYGVYAYPKYEFEYAVSDHHTGDHKRHKESRDGDHVQGEYSLIEPDGSLRKVQYSADDHTGFNAVVSKAMHKHGDNAYSFTGHTRHFLPVGYGQKTKQLFPTVHYHKVYEKPSEVMFKSVAIKAPKILKVLRIEDMKKLPVIVVTDKNNENVEVKKETEEITPAPAATQVEAMNIGAQAAELKPSEEATSVPMTMQEVMAFIMAQNKDMKTRTKQIEQPSDPAMVSVQEMPAMEVVPVVDKKESEKSAPVSDSSVASSYYRPRYYYV